MTKIYRPDDSIIRRTTGEQPVVKPKAEEPPAPPPNVMEKRRRYAKGDGVTTEKPRLPSAERPEVRAAPVPVEARPAGTVKVTDFLRGAVPSSIPKGFVPLTRDNAGAFREAFKSALASGEPWAKDLADQAKQKSGEINSAVFKELSQKDWAGPPPAGAMEKLLKEKRASALDKAETQPWAQALKALDTPAAAVAKTTSAQAATLAAGSAEIPKDLLPITAANVADFKAALRQALAVDEPWAKALISEGQAKAEALETGLREKIGDDEGAEEVGPKGKGDRVQRQLSMALKKAADGGEPWAVALKVQGDLQLEKSQQSRIDQVLKTGFLATPPEAGKGDSSDHGKVKGQVAADGSMKVPAQPENAYVKEYIRTNPVVQALREGGAANIYNPLYQTHLTAAVEANGGIGTAPPEGKGFLALTDHGFALCYNPNRSVEENKKLAELSVKAGLTFLQVAEARVGGDHGDNKLDDALAAFDSFDPTKPGEMKIALDSSANGKWEFTVHSDGQGSVSTIHEHNQSTWTKIGAAASAYGLPVAAVVCAIVPGLQGVAATIVAVASAAKGVYEGIKNGDWLGAVISVVGAVGGGLTALASKGSALASVGGTLSGVAKAAGAIRNTVEAIENKSLSGVLTGIGSAAASIAGVLPDSASDVADAFKKVAEYANKAGTLATFGEAGLAALKNGDYLGALTAAVKLGTTVGKDFLGLDPKLADKIVAGAKTLQAVEGAVNKKDYAGAIQELLSGVKDVTGSDSKLLAGGVALTGMIHELGQKNPLGAAKLAAEFIGELVLKKDELEAKAKDPSLPAEEKTGLAKLIADIDHQLEKFGGAERIFSGVGQVLEAVKAKDPGAILEAATGLVGTLTQDGKIQAAKDVIAAARAAIDAAKNGDFFSQLQAAQALGEAISGALGTSSDPTPDATGAPPAEDPDDEEDPFGIGSGEGGAEVNGRYSVRAGDTLPEIAKKLMGDENRWPELYAYNVNALGEKPGELCAGTKLQVPPEGFVLSDEERDAILGKEPTFPAGEVPAEGPAPKSDEYSVRPGDTLSAIAGRELGDKARWPELYAYNKDLIGKDPNKLRLGMDLKLPPPDFQLGAEERAAVLKAGRTPPDVAPEGPGDDFHDMIGLEPGASGESVGLLDEALHKLGFIDRAIPSQDTFTANTEAALRAFQKKNGLAQTGRVDATTAEALRTAVSNVGATQKQLVDSLRKRISEITTRIGYYTDQIDSLSDFGTRRADYKADLRALNDALQLSRDLIKSPNPDMTALQNREQTLLGMEQKLNGYLVAQADDDVKSLGDDVKIAQVMQSVCDTLVSKLAAKVLGAGPIVSTAYDAIKAGIESYFSSNGCFASAVKGALGNLGGALSGWFTGKALEKVGLPKNVVLQKITGAIESGLSATVENSVRAVFDRQVAFAKRLETLQGQLDSGKIGKNQFDSAVAAEKAKLDKDQVDIMGTVEQEYDRAMAAAFDKALGPYLDVAERRKVRDLSAGELKRVLPDLVKSLKDTWDQAKAAAGAKAGG